MDQCARCGHTLGIGRFCVNCGHPRGAAAPEPADDWRTTTAERPAVVEQPTQQPTQQPSESPWGPTAPSVPLPAFDTPAKVRYPLFADETAEVTTPAAPPPVWETAAPVTGEHRTRRSFVPWMLVAVALLLVAGTGVFLLVGGGDDETASDPPTAQGAPDDAASSDVEPSPPDTSAPETATAPPVDGEPRDVAREASVIAPSTAKPSRDVQGNAVRYDASNMLDGQADTAWRTDGDASGSTIVVDLAGSTRLEQVGLLNGYAKRDPGYDGYTANRRILAVAWVFDDGTSVEQTFGEDRDVQLIDVDVVTTSIEVQILSVSRPARGPAGRDFTAISEISLVGVPE